MASTHPETSPPPPSLTTSPGGTTYVKAEPSTFRAVVQRLTGASFKAAARKSLQELQQRRRAPTKLKIQLCPSAARCRPPLHHHGGSGCYVKGEVGAVSPVSTMDVSLFLASPSPTAASSSSLSPAAEEERAIAEKGFYLHPSPRSGAPPPQLLPLFPLRSPREASLPS